MKIKQTYLLRASFAFLLLMFLGYLVKFYPDNLTGIDTNIQSAMRGDFPSVETCFFTTITNFGNELSLFNQMLLGTLGCYIGTWLVLSITLLISCAMNRSEISIAVGIVFFLITSLLSSILAMAIDRWPWLKWGPINMMNITSQISDHSLKATTKLELHELVLGNIFYIIIFLMLVVFVFKKKNV